MYKSEIIFIECTTELYHTSSYEWSKQIRKHSFRFCCSLRLGWSPDVGTRETIDLDLNTMHFLKCFFFFFLAFICYLFYSFFCICFLLLILLYDNVHMWSTLSLPCACYINTFALPCLLSNPGFSSKNRTTYSYLHDIQ